MFRLGFLFMCRRLRAVRIRQSMRGPVSEENGLSRMIPIYRELEKQIRSPASLASAG